MTPTYKAITENTTKWHRPDRPEWKVSKSIGDSGEEMASAVFRSLGLRVEKHLGQSAFDLSVGGDVEVKRDRLAGKTGHIAIEVAHKGHPSGITNSVADTWAIIIGEGAEMMMMMMPTAGLRALLERGEYRTVAAGESATVALVPVEDIKSISRRLIRAGGQ